MDRLPLARLCWLLSMTACSGDDDGVATLIDAAQPHADAFVKFETWAARAVATNGERGSDEALSDALFAPVRHDSAVVFAQVELEGRRSRRFPLPVAGRLLDVVDGRTIALTHGAGPVGVVLADVCPVDVPGWWRNGRAAGACVVLSRQSTLASALTLRLTMAFEVTSGP